MAVPFAETINVRKKSKQTTHKTKIDPDTGKPWADAVVESTIQGSLQSATEKDTAKFQLNSEGMTSSANMKVYSEDELRLGDEVIVSKGPFKMSLKVIDVDIYQFANSDMNHYCYYCTGSLTNG